MNIRRVIIHRQVIKDLCCLPKHVVLKLQGWVDDVQTRGLNKVRKLPGFHDELLKGKWKGQHSIRLSKAYRAIYEIRDTSEIHFIEVIEVHKHDY